MDHHELKEWRSRHKLTQDAAAALLGVKRSALAQYERGARKLPAAAEERALAMDQGEPAPTSKLASKPAPTKPTAAVAARAVRDFASERAPGCPDTIGEALKRTPLYSHTAREGRLMREEMARRANDYTSHMPLVPLRPVYKRVGLSMVNAAIPDPVPQPAPERFQPRGVLTSTGDIFDAETAHRIGHASD